MIIEQFFNIEGGGLIISSFLRPLRVDLSEFPSQLYSPSWQSKFLIASAARAVGEMTLTSQPRALFACIILRRRMVEFCQ